jgi:son of sevenless-like protein
MSEGDLFNKSWDYTFKGSQLTIVETLLDMDDITKERVQERMQSLLKKNAAAKLKTTDLRNMERQTTQNIVNYHKGKDGRTIMDAASINQIVAKFSKESQDMLTIHHLIVAHAHFVPSTELFGRFVWFYKSAEKSNDFKTTQVIRFRIINIIKKWIELCYTSFVEDEKLGLALLQFKKECLSQNKQLLLHIEKAIETHRDIPTYDFGSIDVDNPKKVSKSLRMKDYSPDEFAQQLTLLDHFFFQRIKISELLNTRWINKPEEAMNIVSAGKRLNNLSYWFAFQIVSQDSLKKKVSMIQYLLKVSQCLIEYRSFESLMAIFLAFNFSCISRLTELWKSLNVKQLQELKVLENLMSPQNNFKGYRELWQKTPPPAVPCQEVYLRDILYHSEGTENFVKDRVLDCLKLDILGEIIEKVRIYKGVLYSFKVNKELIESILDIEVINMEVLTAVANSFSGNRQVIDLTSRNPVIHERKKSISVSTNKKIKRTRSTSLNTSSDLLSPRKLLNSVKWN